MKPRALKLLLLLVWVVSLPVLGGIAARSFQRPRSQAKVNFLRDIQPILAASCYKCHGGDKASGQLKLDVKALAMKGGISGAVIAPGSNKDSRIVHRILGEGGEQRMPLGGAPLTQKQIDLIRRWIDEGAAWPETPQSASSQSESAIPQHWAFVAPVKPASPAVRNQAWARTPIDNFILSRIEKNGLAPSPEAEKTTLLRRLSLDLTGLPPSLQEMDEFLADNSPVAWEKQIERLLRSPHYGERWGRWWLDVARYADTNGFEKDLPRSIWPYRDWVIKAFNEDMPFDRFTVEQLAGDLLPRQPRREDPQKDLDQHVATGFLRNSMLNQEGGVDPEQFRVEGLIDRVDAIGNAFLGLTIKCAQCHNHKFDPIKQTEYYQFYAFLNSDDEPEMEVPDARVAAMRQRIRSEIARLEDELMAGAPDLKDRMAAWERKMAYDESQWTPLMETEIHAIFGVKFERLPDGSFLARGDNATSNNYQIKARTKLKNITGFRIEFLTDPNLPRTGPGRDFDGKFYVSEFIVDAAPADGPDKLTRITLQDPTADYEQPEFPVKNVIDGNQKSHWFSDAGPGLRNQDRKMVFAASRPVGYESGAVFSFQLMQKFADAVRTPQPNIGRFRISVTTAEKPYADPLPSNVRRILAIPAAERTAEQQREVFSFYRTTVAEWADTNKKVEELLRDWPYGVTTLALAPRRWPRETNVFRRGDWKRPGEAVTPGTPALMQPFPSGAPRNRLGLAQWITDKKNPLTARVIVNRIWQQYFGEGLVSTPEDFGLRCDPPSNAELLDWLAVEFMESGWNFKHLHRLITNSAAYRQSSRLTPQLREKDPTNALLARAPRLRVESETVRDIALAASGLLSRKIGGPSVYPPIPDGVLSLGYGGAMPWPTSVGEDRYRRGMYTFWKRNVPYPSMLVFDQPAGDFSCTRRLRSNTPLQALTTLNDQTFVEFAQALALRVWKDGGATDEDKMIYGFRLCTGRNPTASELQKLLKLLADQRPLFDGRTAAAVYVSSADLNALPEDPAGLDLHKLAPWTMVARVLLNLDETITKE